MQILKSTILLLFFMSSMHSSLISQNLVSRGCTCDTPPTPTNPVDGQFLETISVEGNEGTGPNETWTVTGVSNATINGAAILVDGSTTLAFNPQTFSYDLAINSTDNVAYTIMVEGPGAPGDNGNTTLSLSNRCAYYVFTIDGTDEGELVANSRITWEHFGPTPPPSVLVDASISRDGGAAQEYPENQLINQPGNYRIELSIEAGGDDGNNGVSPDGGTIAAYPDCDIILERNFVVNSPPTAVCMDITVSLSDDMVEVSALEVDGGSTDPNDNISARYISEFGMTNTNMPTIIFGASAANTVQQVTLYVVDGIGAESLCSANITILPAAAGVPTMSQWGLIILALLILIFAMNAAVITSPEML